MVIYMSTETYTTTEAGTVTLGRTTYRVEVQADNETGEVMMTWLYGPRGAVYFLRGFLGADTGRRQVISWKSGQPLRVRGNEVRVHQFGDVIEVA